MGHKVFISFKTEDSFYKETIQSWDHLDYVDKSLNEAIGSTNDDYVLRKIREDYLRDSTVTVFLIGAQSNEALGEFEQRFIKGELRASLYDGVGNRKNGILGVVLPEMLDSVFKGPYSCSECGASHEHIDVSDSNVVKEFSYNYFIPNSKCSWSESDRFCVLVSWEDFKSSPNQWIEKAYAKRSEPIASETKVRP